MSILPWAGSEELWYLAARDLAARGVKVDAWYPAWRGHAERLDELSAIGVNVSKYGFRRARVGRCAATILPRLSKRFKTLPYPAPYNEQLGDLVLVSQGAVLDGGNWLRHLGQHGVRYAVLCQANLESQWPSDAQAAELRETIGRAEKVFFVSEENERLFRIQTGYTGPNTGVIWNPLQPGTPAAPLPWPAGQADGLRLAVVGRVDPFAKGQDLVLEVLSQPQWRERDLKVTIYGRGPWRETAARIIRDRGLGNVALGAYLSPEEIWKQHHALLLPSRHEGKSLAMLEAMWLGRPVIATDVGGAREEVIEGETGFLCAAPTVPLLAETMEKMWRERQRLPEMGFQAAARIRTRMPADPGRALADELMDIAGRFA